MQVVCPHCLTKNRLPAERRHEDPRCGECGAALLAPGPVALDEQSFERFVEGTELPVLVDYWADWCGPCQTMAPQFKAAAEQMPEVRFAKVDTDASPRVSMKAHIRNIPTLVLYRGGAEVARRSGAMMSRELVSWVKSVL
ncbi:MAG: thioredoxin [Betaproteobacteria bacterium]|jgi:thioredoxin 2|nr:thioredoxin [Betaproteobacteria bacterium]